jgi:hypothetical protein
MARDEPITYEELSAEHKQRYDEIKAQFEADLIGSFKRTHHHGVRWKGFSPEGALDGVDQVEGVFTTAYVVYKVGGDPVDHQFFSVPPREIPHGYMCAYIPDSSNPVHSAQKAAGGVSGVDADKQAWLAAYATGSSHDSAHSAPGSQTAEQISTILRDQFGILPKRRAIGYTKPYPSDYDLIPLPPKYRLPEFTKFSGAEGSRSIKHVSRYLAQLGMISVSDPSRVRFFLQSLTGPAFGCYTSLGPDSIRTWK